MRLWRPGITADEKAENFLGKGERRLKAMPLQLTYCDGRLDRGAAVTAIAALRQEFERGLTGNSPATGISISFNRIATADKPEKRGWALSEKITY